jgi:GTP diphosphokinase / guanosine-3',5'-bis(diphosphate) 3'-diphosphatase
MIEKAISIALKSHKGQKRLDGKPYIMHPLRMASKAKSESEIIVSILHDVIEDSNIEIPDLEQLGFNKRIIDAINAITHKEGEEYFTYINRLSRNKLARHVKILDLQDNLNYEEWPDCDKYILKLEKYYNALNILEHHGDR